MGAGFRLNHKEVWESLPTRPSSSSRAVDTLFDLLPPQRGRWQTPFYAIALLAAIPANMENSKEPPLQLAP